MVFGFHLHERITDVTLKGVNNRTPQALLVSEIEGFVDFPEGDLKKLRRRALGLIRPSIFTSSKAIPSHTEVACPRPDNIWTFGRATHQGFGIGVSFLVQENLGDFVMATVGGHMQGGQVVVGDVIHRHVMLEEKLDTVQVIPLRGHVQWGQSILEHTRESEFIMLPFNKKCARHKIQHRYEQIKNSSFSYRIPFTV